MVELFVMEYMTVLGMTMVLLFLDSRYSRRRTILTVCSAIVLVMAAVAAIYLTTGLGTTIRIYTLVAHVPSLIICLALSRFRGWRLVFQLLSAILFCMLIHHGAGLIYYLSGNRFWVLLLSYAVLSAGVIWFLLRFLRPLFLQTLLELRRGWWLMCLVMILYYVVAIYLIPGYVGITRSSTILKPAVSLLMVGFYSIVGGNTMHNNVLLYSLTQLAKNRTGRVPVSYEKASLLHEVHHPSVHLFYIRILRI